MNKTKISAKIVADSVSPQGDRLISVLCTFPRIILSEVNTHRMLSKNTSSSRAIPFKKMVEAVENDPFIPIAWQKEHTGMQGYEYFIDSIEIEGCKKLWLEGRDKAIEVSLSLNNGEFIGVTKQLCNRLLEPFMYHTVLVTATEWENFFELRCPKYQTPVSQTIEPQRSWKDLIANHSNPVNLDILENNKDNIIFKLQHNKGAAEIHIMDLAEKMWDAYNESEPKQLKAGEWHIPFGEFNTPQKENNYIDWEAKYIHAKIMKEKNRLPLVEELISESKRTRIKIATARCARISYETLGDNPEINYEKDIKLHDDLLAMKHFSPFEHCAVVMNEEDYYSHIKTTKAESFTISNDDDIYIDGPISFKDCGWSRNLKGFKQYREIIE